MDADTHQANTPQEPTTEWLVNQIAHALRNPIFAALVQIEALALRAGHAPGSDKAADNVYKQLKRLEQAVNEMLAFGRQSKLARASVDVDHLVRSVAETYRRGDREDPAEVTVTGSCPDLQAPWDEGVVRSALERLMDNAVQQTKAPHRIDIQVDRNENGHVVISIVDDGDGIADDLKEQIFLPFFPQHRGRPGLGLAIANKFITLHGGRLTVESRPEGGTEARVVLPL